VYTCPASNKQPKRIFVQTNRLLKKRNILYYSYAIGVKTGHHVNAGHTLVAAAEKEGRTLIAVVLGAEKSEERFADARRMFEAAFAEQKITREMCKREIPFVRNMEGAEKTVKGFLRENIVIESYPSEGENIQAKVEWHDCSLPLAAGDCIGEVQVISGEQIIKKYPLFTAEPIKGTVILKMKVFCKKLFS
jgi:D-alanyl-D-alanine carboxypeptidase (penicillin-binding protein 5/6)